MSDTSPVIVWFRRDLRLSDHRALHAAAETGRPLIPVFIHDSLSEGLGAAPKWRLGLAVERFAARLHEKGLRLILRRGDALTVLRALIDETGARAVYWSRLYDKASRERDAKVKSALKDADIEARSFSGHLLFEPWSVQTGMGGHYKVFTPYWRAVKGRDVAAPVAVPAALRPPETWPDSDPLDNWRMGEAMNRGAAVVAGHLAVGEAAALGRLGAFIGQKIDRYAAGRDFPAARATSGLSENLTYGEIAPATVWHAGLRARHEGAAGAETFLKELAWREFAWNLFYHHPALDRTNWRDSWDDFPWSEDGTAPEVVAWRRGRTGVPLVDAAMREMYITGTMHNRMRMIAASYLTKHLLTHWRIGLAWFEQCLVDWDPASNAMGWQWVAGSGPDAAPYFRIFNPDTQQRKFDPESAYVRRWIAEGQARPGVTALSFFDAVPQSWGLSPADPAPAPAVGLKAGRRRALDAYEATR